jgi:hypothetical protein
MKKIAGILLVTGILFFISGRVTAQTVHKMPIRTVDPYPAVRRTVSVALPIKSGSGSKTIKSTQPGAGKAILPAGVSGATSGAGSAKPPIKGTGNGGTSGQ